MDPAETTADRILRELLMPGKGNSNATITVNAGGVGVWVATTCCLVMLGITIVGALWAASEFRRYDAQLVEAREEIKTNQNYLNAIYQIAPQLKPKDKKE